MKKGGEGWRLKRYFTYQKRIKWGIQKNKRDGLDPPDEETAGKND